MHEIKSKSIVWQTVVNIRTKGVPWNMQDSEGEFILYR